MLPDLLDVTSFDIKNLTGRSGCALNQSRINESAQQELPMPVFCHNIRTCNIIILEVR